MKTPQLLLLLSFLSYTGCAALGGAPLNVPPEFDQKVLLQVTDNYAQHQAPRSGYDSGDLQSFHTQHTLPVVIEEAFKEMFANVELVESEAGVEMDAPDVPAIFEVRILDLANDIYNDSQDYRSEVTLAVAMKSPTSDQIFWQKAFRGSGYVKVDPQFQTGLGPQDAVLDAMRDAIEQMQKAMVSEPQIRLQLQHYKASHEAAVQTDTASS